VINVTITIAGTESLSQVTGLPMRDDQPFKNFDAVVKKVDEAVKSTFGISERINTVVNSKKQKVELEYEGGA